MTGREEYCHSNQSFTLLATTTNVRKLCKSIVAPEYVSLRVKFEYLVKM